MHEIYYDKCQPQIGKIHYIDTDGGFFSFISNKLIADSKIYVRFKYSCRKNMRFMMRLTKETVGKFKDETQKTIWIDELNCLRSKMYKCKSGEKIKKIKRGHQI